MLFLSFALHYTTNALFFDESNLHQIYEDKGKFNINFQLPKIIFSALISTFVLRLILQFLVLTDKDIIFIYLFFLLKDLFLYINHPLKDLNS